VRSPECASTTTRKALRKLLSECDSRISIQPAGRESVGAEPTSETVFASAKFAQALPVNLPR